MRVSKVYFIFHSGLEDPKRCDVSKIPSLLSVKQLLPRLKNLGPLLVLPVSKLVNRYIVGV